MIHPFVLDTLLVMGALALISTFVVYQVSQFRWLTSHGRQINAVVTSIRHETGKANWGISRDHYYLTATWTHPRTGRTYRPLDLDHELQASLYKRQPGSGLD